MALLAWEDEELLLALLAQQLLVLTIRVQHILHDLPLTPEDEPWGYDVG